MNDVALNENNPFEIFNYKNLGRIRVTKDEHGNPWFCLSDVCSILGLTTPSRVAERLFSKGMSSTHTLTNGGIQNLLFINEANLYKTIMGSRKPEAEDFQQWVCFEVIPMIRRTGMYITPENLALMNSDPNFIENMARQYVAALDQVKNLNSTVQYQQTKIEQLQPAADKFNEWLNRPDVVTVREGSLIMALKGIGLKTLFKYFRDHGYVTVKNVAHKRYIDQELFVVKKITTTTANGNTYNRLQTFLTNKGIDYFRDKLIAEGYKVMEFDINSGQEGVISDHLTTAELLEYVA